MIRAFAFIVGICVVSMPPASTAEPGTKHVTWTGWFADSQCASARAKSGTFTATNPDCARKCIEKGDAPVFVSEQAKEIFKVTGYPGVLSDLGYHVEINAAVDEATKTVSVESVKRLSYEGASCQRPKKTSAQ